MMQTSSMVCVVSCGRPAHRCECQGGTINAIPLPEIGEHWMAREERLAQYGEDDSEVITRLTATIEDQQRLITVIETDRARLCADKAKLEEERDNILKALHPVTFAETDKALATIKHIRVPQADWLSDPLHIARLLAEIIEDRLGILKTSRI